MTDDVAQSTRRPADDHPRALDRAEQRSQLAQARRRTEPESRLARARREVASRD